MTIRNMLLPLLALCLMAGACQDTKKVETPVAGVLDLGRVTTSCEAGKAAHAFMEGIQKAYSEQIVAFQQNLGEDENNPLAMQAFETLYSSLQSRLQQEDQAATEKLLSGIMKAAETVRQEKGLKFILRSDMAIAFEKELDVTDLVVAALNRTPIEFTPVTGDPKTDEATAAALKTMQEAKAKAAEAAPEAAPAPAETPAAPEAAAAPAETPAAPEAAPAPAETPAAPEAAPAPAEAGK